ncbi:MAG: co-chaperone GroES [Paenibacillus sp. RIFOXYA1_FULL_44_5]|nr:MAG: co-chaperone GroES [Paenibacillus sp. RIFOXYA1_FULL_44_5]
MIKPLGDRVVLEPVVKEVTTVSGIVLPDSVKEKPQEGKVVAVGKDLQELKLGDHVIFSKYAGTELKHDGKELLIMRESDILAVLG